MKIAVIGTGYVGLTVACCLAELGHDVTGVDIDKAKIDKLKKNICPIYEPGMEDLLSRNQKEKRLQFTTEIKKGIEAAEAVFIAVGTPSNKDGSVDTSYVEKAAKQIGRNMDGYKVIVNKSTVPVGSAERVKDIIRKNLSKKTDFDVVSNPEFLREGAAIKDFMNPDRTVLGVESGKAREIMLRIYNPLERTNKPIMITDTKSAEMIKYASNAFLATKISFINEIATLCEKTGADVKEVGKGIGLDSRIGPRFLQAGIGWGGSCFPKDVMALIAMAKQHKTKLRIAEACRDVNDEQKKSLVPKLRKLLGSLKGKKIAVWGLAFKPKTDDMREAPAITLIQLLQKEGARIRAFDPVAEENAKKIFKNIEFGKDPYDTLKGCDALAIVTEWSEFISLDKKRIKSCLKRPCIVDGRNIYEPGEMRKLGFTYIGIGR